MERKNGNISLCSQNHAITQKHFGKLEIGEIASKGLENKRCERWL